MGKLTRLPVRSRARKAGAPEVRRIRRRRHSRYYAFLSYSHRDKELADWLHKEIEKFRVPRALVGRLTDNGVVPKRLTPVFRDEQELAAAADLGDEIRQALEASQFLIVLCSPHAATSHWTNAEIEEFKRARPDDNILAAIASGEPFASDIAGREDEECFPPALRYQYDRRGRPTPKRAEPLAADLRGEGDVRRIGFLKLIAGMLGVGLDELVQRETRRRHQRLAWLVAASIGGMAVTSGLAFAAIQARDAARDQRREAEGLVAYMVGDLKDKLEPIGRLDALDGVGERVLAYYSKQDTSELSDAGLMQRSRALGIVGQVAYLRGNYGSATGLYRQALAGTAEALRRNPDDPRRMYEHAQNVFWVGELARRQGRIAEAERAFLQYRDLAQRMTTIQPDNLKWRMEVLYATENLGIVRMAQRRFAEAQQIFASEIGPMAGLTSLDPGNHEYQSAFTNILGWQADSLRSLGRFDEAIATRRRQAATILQFMAGGSRDIALETSLIPAHQALGYLFNTQGHYEQALTEFRSAQQTADRLLTVDSGNRYLRDMVAAGQLKSSQSLLGLGRRDEASEAIGQACAEIMSLNARSSDVTRWTQMRTECFETQARTALASSNGTQAEAFANRALLSVRMEKSGDSVTDQYRIAAVYRLLGEVRERNGNSVGAAEAWNAGLERLPANATETPWEMSDHARILRSLGRAAEAQALEANLKKAGFRDLY